MKVVKIDSGTNDSEPLGNMQGIGQFTRLEEEIRALSSELVETNKKLDFMQTLILNAGKFILFVAMPILAITGSLLSLWIRDLFQ